MSSSSPDTDADADAGVRHPASGTSYLRVLRIPGTARLFAVSLWGRLSYGTLFLALMLAITHTTGSYALAGACNALFGLTAAVLAPARAALIDRHGPRRALPPMAVVYVFILATLAVATWRPGTPKFLLLTLCTAAGASAPPLGPTMRALWAGLIDDPMLRQRAYALDTVSEEVLYITGPLLAGGLAAWVDPAAGVALSAFLMLGGVLALAAALPGPGPAQAAAPTATAPVTGRRRPWSRWRPRRARLDLLLEGAIPVSAATGVTLAALSLLAVAFAQRHHDPDAVAWVEAAQSAGSVIGGLVYGVQRRRLSTPRQMLMLIGMLGVVVATAGAIRAIWLLAIVVGVSGLFVSPTITMTYVVADEAAAPQRRTEAGTLVNSAYNAGSSFGSAGTGLLLGACPLSLCFVLAALPAWFAVAGGLAAGRRRSAIGSPSDTATGTAATEAAAAVGAE